MKVIAKCNRGGSASATRASARCRFTQAAACLRQRPPAASIPTRVARPSSCAASTCVGRTTGDAASRQAAGIRARWHAVLHRQQHRRGPRQRSPHHLLFRQCTRSNIQSPPAAWTAGRSDLLLPSRHRKVVRDRPSSDHRDDQEEGHVRGVPGLHGHRRTSHGMGHLRRSARWRAMRVGVPDYLRAQNRRIGIPAHRPPYDRPYSAFSAVPEGCNRGNCSQVVTGRQSRLARSAPARSSCTAVCTCVHEKSCELSAP